jgi:hypothetical protein
VSLSEDQHPFSPSVSAPASRCLPCGLSSIRSRGQATAVVLLSLPSPSQPSQTAHLRGTRYGEILLITSEEGQLTAAVYNTTGLNDCPVATWRSLDPRKLAKDFGVFAVYLNGPRFWTLDKITAHSTGEIRSFDGLDARWVAELPIPPGLTITSQTTGRYYRDIAIKRDTEWVFTAGRPAYELQTPDGKIYIMQAYSHIVDDRLTPDSLPALADRLHIPQGWHYRQRTPEQDLTLRAIAGQAHMLQDELHNTYMQLMTP